MIVKRAVIDANRQLVEDGVTPIVAKARVPERVLRADREWIDSIIAPYPDRILADPSFRDTALTRKTKDEPKEETLKRVVEAARAWVHARRHEFVMFTSIQYETAVRGVMDQLWNRVESGEVELSDPPAPAPKLDQQAGQQDSPGETMG